MCRTAGRRCPSYSDPAAITARNARRRAAYAAKKAAEEVGQVSAAKTVGSLAQEAVRSKIGVSSTTVAPELHYAPQVVRGVINYKALDGESYKEFGFTNPEEDEPLCDRQDEEDYQMGYSAVESERECATLSQEERGSVRYFTTSSYSWINDKLYRSEKLRSLPPETSLSRKRAKVLMEDLYCAYENDEGRSLLREVTSSIDSALAKGPGKQRIVYRGIAAGEMFGIEDPYGEMEITPTMAEKWVDENRSLGTEVVFDGYTSTSIRGSVVSGFHQGVVYEILTPQGMAISSISQVRREDEVLLPRKQRYMVVGVHKNQNLSNNADTQGIIIQLVAINSRGEVLDGTNADPIEPVDVGLE